jgi:hypothetical protein
MYVERRSHVPEHMCTVHRENRGDNRCSAQKFGHDEFRPWVRPAGAMAESAQTLLLKNRVLHRLEDSRLSFLSSSKVPAHGPGSGAAFT